jgi:hypothetical protein
MLDVFQHKAAYEFQPSSSRPLASNVGVRFCKERGLKIQQTIAALYTLYGVMITCSLSGPNAPIDKCRRESFLLKFCV